jgi:hypothetical protein
LERYIPSRYRYDDVRGFLWYRNLSGQAGFLRRLKMYTQKGILRPFPGKSFKKPMNNIADLEFPKAKIFLGKLCRAWMIFS